jgi:hypothetical protein
MPILVAGATGVEFVELSAQPGQPVPVVRNFSA